MLKSGGQTQHEKPELSVIVADDDRLTALTLSDSLVRHGIRVLATEHNARDAIASAIKFRPKALVVDLDFGPGPNGIDVAIAVRRQLPKIGVVIVTAYEDPRLLAPDLPKPPEGTLYLVKHQLADPEQVAVAARRSIETVAAPGTKSVSKKAVNLTDSQIELLRLVALGFSNQAIAESLSLTPESVKKSITRLAKRLHVDHTSESNLRVELTHKYLQHSGYSRV